MTTVICMESKVQMNCDRLYNMCNKKKRKIIKEQTKCIHAF